MPADAILATCRWRTNGELIAACAELGYLTGRVLDPTYGQGTWWSHYCPDRLDASDLDPDKSPTGVGVDFTDLPWLAGTFDAVAFDPPYKLNGTPDPAVDHRYGVDVPASWKERHRLIRQGISEAARVLLPGGYLLLKCQDQVCSGKVRWQTHEFTNHAADVGLELVDRFDMLSYRAQPAGRRQVHARRNSSTLLVFQKAKA